MTHDTNQPRRLNPWNPLDHLRLLWWLFVTPKYLKAYRDAYGKEADRVVGRWLVNTLIDLPVLVVTLARGLNTLPRSDTDFSPSSYLLMSAGVILTWALTGWLKKDYNIRIVTVCVVSVVAYTTLSIWAGIVALVVGYVMIERVAESMEESLRTGQPSLLVQMALWMLLLAYIFLVWFSFLGGWRKFR